MKVLLPILVTLLLLAVFYTEAKALNEPQALRHDGDSKIAVKDGALLHHIVKRDTSSDSSPSSASSPSKGKKGNKKPRKGKKEGRSTSEESSPSTREDSSDSTTDPSTV